MTRREALAQAEAALAAALERTEACRDRYDSAIAPDAVARYETALNAAYDAEIIARENLILARELAPAPIRLRRERAEVL